MLNSQTPLTPKDQSPIVFTDKIACIPGILSIYPGIPSAIAILIPIYSPPNKISSICTLADLVSPSPAVASSPIDVPVSVKSLPELISVVVVALVFTVSALYLYLLFVALIISGEASMDSCITRLHVLSISVVVVLHLVASGIINDKSSAAPKATTL